MSETATTVEILGGQYLPEGGGGSTPCGRRNVNPPISLSLKYSSYQSPLPEKMVSSDQETESEPASVNGGKMSPPPSRRSCPQNGHSTPGDTCSDVTLASLSDVNNSSRCSDNTELPTSVIKLSASPSTPPPSSFPSPLQGGGGVPPAPSSFPSPLQGGEVPPSPEGASPPGSPDDSLLDSMDFPPPPPPQVDRPSALRLAKRLYNLEGFKKQDVSRQLSKKNDFSHIVAECYFQQFNLSTLSLDLALRAFLAKCILVGETQERERVLMYFSHRYLECNPQLVDSTFRSQDSLHTLTCAVVLLNTDLHNPHMQMKRMGPKDFVENLTGLNDGLNFPSDILYGLYTSIRNHPLDWGEHDGDGADTQEAGGGEGSGRAAGSPGAGASSPTTGGGAPANSAATAVNLTGNQAGGINPFLTLPDSNGLEYKKGYIVRKCCYDANGKKTKLGKRGWRMFYVTLRDLVLFCFKDEKSSEQPGAFTNPQVAVRLHSALAHKAADYRKRKHVFRLVLADRAEFLFRTTNEEELDTWVTMINTVVSRLSSPPLPAACSSSAKFQRPLYPSSVSQLSLQDQIQSHQQQIQQLQSQLADLTAEAPEDDTTASAAGRQPQENAAAGKTTSQQRPSPHQEQVEFLLSEKERYGTYIRCLLNLSSSANTPDSDESSFNFQPGSTIGNKQNQEGSTTVINHEMRFNPQAQGGKP